MINNSSQLKCLHGDADALSTLHHFKLPDSSYNKQQRFCSNTDELKPHRCVCFPEQSYTPSQRYGDYITSLCVCILHTSSSVRDSSIRQSFSLTQQTKKDNRLQKQHDDADRSLNINRKQTNSLSLFKRNDVRQTGNTSCRLLSGNNQA